MQNFSAKPIKRFWFASSANQTEKKFLVCKIFQLNRKKIFGLRLFQTKPKKSFWFASFFSQTDKTFLVCESHKPNRKKVFGYSTFINQTTNSGLVFLLPQTENHKPNSKRKPVVPTPANGVYNRSYLRILSTQFMPLIPNVFLLFQPTVNCCVSTSCLSV